MIWLALLAAASPTHFYHVDLSRAVLATPDGKAARAEIEGARGTAQAGLRSERQRLLARRGQLLDAEYAQKVEALNARIAAAEARLDARQDELLAPILAKMDQLIAAEHARAPSARISPLADAPQLAPNRLCDRTGWLAEAYRGTPGPPGVVDACRVDRFAYVGVDAAVRQTAAAKKAAAQIRAMQDKRQAELDRFRQELTRLSAERRAGGDPRLAGEVERLQADLGRRFARYQAELAAKERAAQVRLRRRVEAAALAARRAHPRVVFVERLDGVPTDLTPNCDVTDWMAKVIDDTASPTKLPAACGN